MRYRISQRPIMNASLYTLLIHFFTLLPSGTEYVSGRICVTFDCIPGNIPRITVKRVRQALILADKKCLDYHKIFVWKSHDLTANSGVRKRSERTISSRYRTVEIYFPLVNAISNTIIEIKNVRRNKKDIKYSYSMHVCKFTNFA